MTLTQTMKLSMKKTRLDMNEAEARNTAGSMFVTWFCDIVSNQSNISRKEIEQAIEAQIQAASDERGSESLVVQSLRDFQRMFVHGEKV